MNTTFETLSALFPLALTACALGAVGYYGMAFLTALSHAY